MKALEKDPQTYDLEFKKQFPEANFIYDLIKSRIGQEGRVLEIGCGSGRLAIDMAKRGLDVVGIDVSEKMIEHARATSKEENVDLTFLTGNFISLAILKHLENSGPFDFIISTFALSEFTPLQQELFLKQMSKLLNRQGVCYLAADTAPISGLARVRYSIKNFISAQISIFKDIPSTSPVINLEGKLKPYFKSTQIFQAKSVKLFEITNRSDDSAAHAENQDLKSTLGHFSQLKTGYCIVNGILTRKSIKPGLYRVGNPKNNSPLLVTANYYWTVNSVYNTLRKQQINCFLLIIDSNGINVWCAAGGGHFTHTQVLEAIRLFNVEAIIDHSTLLLPQLSATGVDRKELSKAGWKPIFGPVDISDISSFLDSRTKTTQTSSVEFSFLFRTLMGIQHAFFISCVLFLPLLLILSGLAMIGIPLSLFWVSVVLQLFILGLATNFAFIWSYPIFEFTSSFFKKGLSIAIINSLVAIVYLTSQGKNDSLFTYIFWIALIVVVSLFIVLDLAGNTPYTNHLDVESDLTLFMVPAIILSVIAIIIPLINSEIEHLFF